MCGTNSLLARLPRGTFVQISLFSFSRLCAMCVRQNAKQISPSLCTESECFRVRWQMPKTRKKKQFQRSFGSGGGSRSDSGNKVAIWFSVWIIIVHESNLAEKAYQKWFNVCQRALKPHQKKVRVWFGAAHIVSSVGCWRAENWSPFKNELMPPPR